MSDVVRGPSFRDPVLKDYFLFAVLNNLKKARWVIKKCTFVRNHWSFCNWMRNSLLVTRIFAISDYIYSVFKNRFNIRKRLVGNFGSYYLGNIKSVSRISRLCINKLKNRINLTLNAFMCNNVSWLQIFIKLNNISE